MTWNRQALDPGRGGHDYITLCSLDAQQRVLEETSIAYRRSLELTQKPPQGGIATDPGRVAS